MSFKSVYEGNTWLDANPNNLSKTTKEIKVEYWQSLPSHPLKEGKSKTPLN